MTHCTRMGLVGLMAVLAAAAWAAEIPDELKVKRQDVFAFTEKPSITRKGDRVTIRFASEGYCDATVAIENEAGRIVRHLASGVLGARAPAPFQPNSLKQTLVWDCKDDQGHYLDQLDRLTVRVSLGLKPAFEKNLYWSPYKRISEVPPLICSTDEGVVVCEGRGVDSVKLFDREGAYVRTIYPFPADKLEKVGGLNWYDFPQGLRLPIKHSLYQQTLLTSGNNCNDNDAIGRSGWAATALAARGNDLALAFEKLNRITCASTTWGGGLEGGKTSAKLEKFRIQYNYNNTVDIGPTSAAISPDGKWIYLTGYSYRYSFHFDTLHGVARMPADGSTDARLFAGNLSEEDKHGDGDGQFRNATCVDCDAQGRVYVGDFMNDRIQVFDADGKHLKNIPAAKPAGLRIDRKTGKLYVFSWLVPSTLMLAAKPPVKIQPALTVYGPFDQPEKLKSLDLPAGAFGGNYSTYTGISYAHWFSGEVDTRTDPPTVWFGRECRNNAESGVAGGNGGVMTAWEKTGILVLREKDGKLEVVRDFGKLAKDEAVRAKPPTNAIQRLIVNPVTGALYVGEADSGPTIKSSRQWLEIDPDSGKTEVIELPFNAMEGCFDLEGLIYLRSTDAIMRFDPKLKPWREVPFDYGEEVKEVGDVIFQRYAPAKGAILLPSRSPVCFHQGGIHVSPMGLITVACAYRAVKVSQQRDDPVVQVYASKSYEPPMYPGRVAGSTVPCIHVYDKKGKILYEDALPGVSQVDGVALDRDEGLYVMHTPSRMLDGKRYFNDMSSTLTKVPVAKAKILSTNPGIPLPLPEEQRPQRPPDIYDSRTGTAWVEGADWMYGGVGYAGFNAGRAGGGCACWFARWDLDLFARSIVPEPHQFSVGMLDKNGNLILRIGGYGNVDGQGKTGRDPNGDDGVSLFHPCYVATHSDRRVFISDYGNGRIVSVKLTYHANETVALKNIPDEQK